MNARPIIDDRGLMTEPDDSVKDELTTHWDLDYMTDAQREAVMKRKRNKHAGPTTRERRDEAHAFAAPEAESGPELDWRMTAAAAAVVATLTGVAWLLWRAGVIG